MEEKNDKKRGRGRPQKKPIDPITRSALMAFGIAFEQRLIEENHIENSIDELITKSRYSGLSEKIEKFIISKRKLNRYQTEEFNLQLDFWKNFIKAIKGKEDCDWPRERTLDKLIQFTFTNDDEVLGLTWRDYLAIFNRYKDSFSVTYFAPELINVENLYPQQLIIMGWVPQHFYIMQYKGDYTFEIKIAGDGMVHKRGDKIRAVCFFVQSAIEKLVIGDQTITIPAYAPPYISYKSPIEEYL